MARTWPTWQVETPGWGEVTLRELSGADIEALTKGKEDAAELDMYELVAMSLLDADGKREFATADEARENTPFKTAVAIAREATTRNVLNAKGVEDAGKNFDGPKGPLPSSSP